MSPSSFPEAWGGVAVSILVSAVLNGGIIMQACSYFSRFQKDPLVLKCTVAVICTPLQARLFLAIACWVLHSFSILGYDVLFYDVVVPPGFSIAIALEVIVHATTQGTYIFRMYRFGKNPYLLVPSCILVLVELGLDFTWVAPIAISGPVQVVDARDQGIEWGITSFFTISAFLGVFITMSVSYQLMRSRVNGLKRTKHLIDRIIRWTLPTGLLTSSVAIAIVLAWNLKRDSFVWTGLCAFVSECYAIGLLALLNARRTSFTIADSDHLSLPMATLSASPMHAGAFSSSIAVAAAAAVPGLSAPSDKVVATFRDGRAGPEE